MRKPDQSGPGNRRLTAALAWTGIFALAALAALPLCAQAPSQVALEPSPDAWLLPMDRGAAALWQTLLKLHTRASLLLFTAHPDDEDGGMLAYESRGQGARVAMLTLNRGEGGQNVMSNDYWDALGLVRTQELLAADRYVGVNQYWASVADFGFSKTKEEALEKWGHDRVLADVVRVVRMVRPLVVTSVFVGAPSDGHGQHQVAGQMAQEVFDAAGDPNAFPDQIKAGLRPWKPLKMYARVPFFSVSDKGMFDYARGKWLPVRFYDYIHKQWIESALSTNVEIPEGDYAPLLGATYLQVAREGLGLQKSQNGGGAIPLAGPMAMPYHRFGSRVSSPDKEKSYFDGIDTSLVGIADLARDGDNSFLKQGLTRINALVEQAITGFSVQNPEKIAPVLAEGLKATGALIAQVESSKLPDQAKYDVEHELRVKRVQFNNAVVQALGFSLVATVSSKNESPGRFAFFAGTPETFRFAIPGQEFNVKVHVANQSSTPLRLDAIRLQGPKDENWDLRAESPGGGTLASDHVLDQWFDVRVPENATPTRPYFVRPSVEQPYYDLLDERYRGLPLAPYPLSAWVEFSYQGATLRIAQVVQTVRRITGPGTVLDPLMVAPAISVRISPSAGIVPLDHKEFSLTANVRSEVKGPAKGTLRLELPVGWRATPEVAEFSTQREGEEHSLNFTIFPSRLEEKPYAVTAVAEYNGRSYKAGFVTTGFEGSRPYNLYREAAYRATGVDVKVAPGLNVGYVNGTGDDVPQSLENLGIKVHFLSSQDLAAGDLRRYDVIVLGVRTYAARPELKTCNGRLLDYVNNGGVMVVQYNTPQYDHNYGPYPYSLTNDPEKVVDENSRVSFLEPQNPVLTWPNKIGQKDFEGWVEERGHDFMHSWDPHYETPLETHDPDQDPQKGGLLYAHYGRGVYIYIAYALYRQLPEGVPGAYRLFANLVSLARHPRLAGEKTASQPTSNK